MSQKNISSKSAEVQAPHQSGSVQNSAVESKDDIEPKLSQGIVSSLSEADRSVFDQLAKSAMDEYHRALDHSPLPTPRILDALGQPLVSNGAPDLVPDLVAEPQEALTMITIPASDFEKLSAKTAQILREAELAYERITKDREETELLKAETRELLARLRAA